ncbi:tetratricopeptide repeat protein [Desulfolutivibrio sulfoxidireducens]|uniref:tetratricopeptide repeat protein n=1 Tax=Desulfolutivibrio sulfoxidireducens TaxID=2773299 RepID=UPI00159D09D4|nr:tetratricopeptide repeat protein [Desulfolutivibrio sulfoxidireducens]QLA17193.1 tetratricopeptide repeat protein [Desulfolutivibrio sulfoxidireducens]
MEDVDLKEQLERQLKFLRRSCEIFDSGNEDEALRIATTLRTLLRDAKSDSLFKLLGQKNDIFLLSTIPAVEDIPGLPNGKIVSVLPIMLTSDGQKPSLEKATKKVLFPVKEWLNEKLIMEDGESLTREDVITTAANKDGGTHVEIKPNKKLKILKKSLGELTISEGNRKIIKELKNIHFVILRQMAYEVLNSQSIYDLNNIEYVPEIENKSYSEYLREANEFAKDGRHYQAIESYKKAIKVKGDCAEVAYNNMGNSFVELGEKEEARLAYRKAIELNPIYVDPMFHVSIIYQKEKRYDLAISMYRKILDIDKNHRYAQHNYEVLKNYLTVESELEYQLKNVFPVSEDAVYLHLLGYGLMNCSRFSDALAVMEKALRLSGGDSGVLCNLATIHLKLNEHVKAETIFKLLAESSIFSDTKICLNILEYSVVYNKFNTSELCNRYKSQFGNNGRFLALVSMLELLHQANDKADIDIETEFKKYDEKYQNVALDYDFADLNEWANSRENANLSKLLSFFKNRCVQA